MFVNLDFPWGGQGHLNVVTPSLEHLIKCEALSIFKVTLLKRLSNDIFRSSYLIKVK